MTRSLDRLRQAVEQSQDEYAQKLDQQWLATVADQYRGHSVKEIIGGRGKNSKGEVVEYEAGWNDSLNDDDVDKLADYIEDPTKFLILRGTAGTGKSTLAATLGRKMVHDHQFSGAFVNSVSLISEFSYREDYKNPVRHFSDFDLLVIDDLGAVTESLTAHQQKALWNLIESRWSVRNKYTIITTNMAIQDNNEGLGLSSWIGESAWDRIASDLTRVNMSGDSFRL